MIDARDYSIEDGDIVFHRQHGGGQVREVHNADSVLVDFNQAGPLHVVMAELSRNPIPFDEREDPMTLERQRIERLPPAEQLAATKRLEARGGRKPAKPYDMVFFDDIDPNIYKEWTVEDLMGVGELVVPYGAPGCGKSVLIGDMVCHIAGELAWFGKRTRRAAVLYVAAERAQLVERRFAAFRKHHAIEGLPVAVIKGYFDLAKAESDTDRVIATVDALAAKFGTPGTIVVIDTKRQVIADENSDDVGKLVSNISRIQAATGAGIIVIDHSPFHTPTKPSGRGELVAAADVTFLLEKSGATRAVSIKKANDGPDDFGLAFTLASVELGRHPESGKVTTAPVVVPADASEPVLRTLDRLTTAEQIALAALQEAIVDAGEAVTSEHVPPGCKAVSVELWREYAYKRGISDADNSDARKKAFKRTKASLAAKGRVGVWDERVWIATDLPSYAHLKSSRGTGDIGGTNGGHVPEHKGDIGGHNPIGVSPCPHADPSEDLE